MTTPHRCHLFPYLRSSECLTGDAFASLRCDCGPQLTASLKQIGQNGGILFYLMQEGRGIGLAAKLQAYALQDQGLDTYEANEALGFEPDVRTYAMVAQFLLSHEVRHVRLLTNNPHKIHALEDRGITVDRVGLHVGSSPHNEKYLKTKRNKFGHLA